MTTQLRAWKYNGTDEVGIYSSGLRDNLWNLNGGWRKTSEVTNLRKVRVVDEESVVIEGITEAELIWFTEGLRSDGSYSHAAFPESFNSIKKRILKNSVNPIPPVQEPEVRPDFEQTSRSFSKGVRLIRKVANSNGNPNLYRIAIEDGWNPDYWSVYLEGAEKIGALFFGKWDSILKKYDVLPVQEPKNFGAVIRARCEHSPSDLPDVQDTYVRITDGRKFPWSGGDGTRHSWSDLTNPVVKSLGIPND